MAGDINGVMGLKQGAQAPRLPAWLLTSDLSEDPMRSRIQSYRNVGLQRDGSRWNHCEGSEKGRFLNHRAKRQNANEA
jgi:hypothetical protein